MDHQMANIASEQIAQKTIYIQQGSHFLTQSQNETELRQQLKEWGVEARRLSRFSQLCLLGALPLKSYITPNTAIYLASPFNSPSKFNKLFYQLMEQNLPSPLDFMANLSNATVFQLAQLFKTTGNSLFLTANPHQVTHPLQLAKLDLQGGMTTQALVGWGYEAPTSSQWEGSCWWLLSTECNEHSESAVQNLTDFSTALSHLTNTEHYLKFGMNIQNLTKFLR